MSLKIDEEVDTTADVAEEVLNGRASSWRFLMRSRQIVWIRECPK